MIASFGQEPNIAEGSSNNATIHTDDAGYGELLYQIRYVEQNGRGLQNSWSRRHTGIYHRRRASDGADIMVVLHPVRAPVFADAIAALQTDSRKREEICENSLYLHEMLFACYMDNWRWYMRSLGEPFSKLNDFAMVMKTTQMEPTSSFARVQELRNTNDLIFLARACCAGNLELLERLTKLPGNPNKSTSPFELYRVKLSGLIESADVLKGRVQNGIDLVSAQLGRQMIPVQH